MRFRSGGSTTSVPRQRILRADLRTGAGPAPHERSTTMADTSNIRDKAKDTAAAAGHAASEAASTLTQKASEAASNLGQKAQDTASQVRDKAQDLTSRAGDRA